MVGTGTRGAGLMLLGAALLLFSLAIFGYSRYVEWQHAMEAQALAPPREVLPSSFALPTPSPRASTP